MSLQGFVEILHFWTLFTDQFFFLSSLVLREGPWTKWGACTRQKTFDEAVSLTGTWQTCNQGVK